MTSIYDQIIELYDVLNETDNVKRAEEIMRALVAKGVDKGFIETTFKTISIKKMALYLHDKVTEETKAGKKTK